MINYKSTLSPTRLRNSSHSDRTILTESESDRGRVLFSPAFRRLQQKAQVFSMEPNAAVRSRLTHSLEVSQIGRFIADEICLALNRRKKGTKLSELEQGAFVNFVETACLMHDIGNPPFGHFGEAAIQEWFRQNGSSCLLESMGLDNTPDSLPTPYKNRMQATLADFIEFDGNPQGLRIVSRLQWNKDEFGLNLTSTSIAAFLKYVRCAGEPADETGFRKKAGHFTTEKDIVEQVWGNFNYTKPQRFPLAYVMEAADDIAYCISDLEDSFEKGIVDAREAFTFIRQAYKKRAFNPDAPCHKEIESALTATVNGKLDGEEFTFIDFRSRVNTAIVRYAADKFVKSESQIARGNFPTLLPPTEPPGFFLDLLKTYCRQHVYTHASVQRVELAGYNAISGLLEQFRPLLSASRSRFKECLVGKNKDKEGRRILLEPKLLKLFPERYRKVYSSLTANYDNGEADNFLEWNARAHLVTDFIAGMTDDFAMKTYRTLVGIDV